jgi:moderate conductance mechanosensitive channel
MLEPIEIFGVDGFTESAVIIKARLKTLPLQQFTIGREYRKRLKKAFEVAGIEMRPSQRAVRTGEATQLASAT